VCDPLPSAAIRSYPFKLESLVSVAIPNAAGRGSRITTETDDSSQNGQQPIQTDTKDPLRLYDRSPSTPRRSRRVCDPLLSAAIRSYPFKLESLVSVAIPNAASHQKSVASS
jgi:hypothetical protein